MLLTGVIARGQLSTADVSGAVKDSSKLPVSKATVTIRNLETNQPRTAETNEVGIYSFTFLQPGRYSVRIEAPGFKVFDVPELILAGGDHGRADAALQPGTVMETIEIVGQTPLLQPDTVERSSTITKQAVESLPVAERNLTRLVFLNPGVHEGL